MKARILSLICILCLSAGGIGCANSSPELAKVTNVYKMTELSLPDGMSASELECSPNGAVIVLVSDSKSDSDYAREYYLGFAGDGDVISTVAFDLDERESKYMLALAPKGAALMLTRKYDESGRLAGYSLHRYESEKKLTLADEVAPLFETDPAPYIQSLTVDTEGLIYIATEYSLVILDRDGTKLDEFELEHELSSLNVTHDGRLLAEYYRSDRLNRAYLDTDNRRFGEAIEISPNLGIANREKLFAEGYDFYYSSDESFFGYNFADGEPIELVNWVNSDIIKGYIRELAVLDADNILCIESEKLCRLTRVPDDEVKAKALIELAVVYTSPELIRTIVNFNRENDDYRVILKNYRTLTAADDPEGASKLLSNDFVSGNAPDVVIMSGFVCIDELAESGAFADIYELIDADETMERADFFENILAGFEYDGVLAYLPDDIRLGTLVGKASELPERFDASGFVAYAQSLSDGKYLFEDSLNPQSLLSLVLENSLSSFIDFENATCDFGADYARILEFCKSSAVGFSDSASRDELADLEDDVALPYREGRIALVKSNFGSVRDLFNAEFLVGDYGEDNPDSIEAYAVGYPSAADARNGTLIDRYNGYAISGASRVKDGAWQLVKALLSDREGKLGDGFSPIRSIFDSEAAEQVGYHCFFYLDGGVSGGSGEYRPNPRNPKPGVLRYVTKADAEAVRELFAGARRVPLREYEIMDIITEEADAYFASAKSLDETVAVISDRVSVYVSENY